jgi:hypothetical protein
MFPNFLGYQIWLLLKGDTHYQASQASKLLPMALTVANNSSKIPWLHLLIIYSHLLKALDLVLIGELLVVLLVTKEAAVVIAAPIFSLWVTHEYWHTSNH